jgi:pyruvate/2-oxoglutarate dehydrogenase complex dihydrolipoamide dehydrogenase (E3) component
VADATARIVIRNALFMGQAKVSDLVVPWTTYTQPEIAHVGMYEAETEEKGINIRAFRRDFENVDRAKIDGETNGFVKIITEKGKDKILGATIVADNAGDMISEITLAMKGGIGLSKLADVIHPYPTRAEAIKQAGDAYNRARLTPFIKKLFSKWLAWTR